MLTVSVNSLSVLGRTQQSSITFGEGGGGCLEILSIFRHPQRRLDEPIGCRKSLKDTFDNLSVRPIAAADV